MRNFANHTELETALALPALESGAFRFAKQFGPATFTCVACGLAKPLNTDGCGSTGYGRDDKDALICFDCCGNRDLADMVATGRATLYLSPLEGDARGRYKVTNWPGTLQRNTYGPPRVSRRNIARKRYDVWFTGPDGFEWHGVQYGDDTQICHCRRTNKRIA